MAKKAKKIQTDYTKGGRDISNTAIPLYQTNLQRIDEYNANPTAMTDEMLAKYYTNTPAQNDFLRNYQRAMSNTTANNYAATQGGYSSAGQQAYNDVQRAQNDFASRLYDTGIANSAAMAQQYFNNLLGSTDKFQQAYALGKDYSDIEQYNNMVSQNNKWYNQVAQALPAVGTAVGSMFSPAGAAIGGAVGGALGSSFATDTSDFFGAQGVGAAQAAGTGAQGGQYVTQWTPVANAFQSLATQRATNNNNTPAQAVDDFGAELRKKINEYGGIYGRQNEG